MLNIDMETMNECQRNVLKVLERIQKQVVENEDDAAVYAEEFETMLNNLAENDFFGTEGSTDPRGDQRNGFWTMDDIEP
jgi:aromatic ring hydroxylase